MDKFDSLSDTESVKSQLTSDREYFIIADFNLDKDRLVTLLKGFSAFKRMLHSSWKFVVVLRAADGIKKEEAEHLLSNYKYREDIVLTNDDKLNEKIAEAYALISVSVEEIFPIPVAEAVRLKTPVIALKTETLDQLYGDAIVYTENAGSEAIGEMLMMIYKGETFRKNLIKKIEARQLSYNMDDVVKILKQNLLQ
ncbi:glycosyltransferase [Niabella ginsengisoli]|uniref:Glycosyltransferase n=1 Tax=Niabella ginsengisoli TaxID=522298 RepID=A0ABS9SN57_9BACT|nr:glycosyltransferase [Niabella ginsengisoli]MCH5599711.1 glycosyltransferase [Niabella ginsengisoli]